MSEFTYEWPNAEDFYAGVRAVVQSQYSYEKELCSLVDIGHCDFYDTTDFSRNRWNAYYAEVHFFIPIDAYSKYGGMLDKYQNLLLGVCQKVMPPETGYDIMKVTISPILSSEAKKNALTEIKKVVEESAYLNINDDLIEKGKKMADAYVTLYALENFVRQYIDKKLTEKIGPNYMNNVSLPKKNKKRNRNKENTGTGEKVVAFAW